MRRYFGIGRLRKRVAPGGLVADARPGGMAATPHIDEVLCPCRTSSSTAAVAAEESTRTTSSIQFSKNRPFVAAGLRGPKRGDNAASRPARVPRWVVPLKAPPAVPLSEGEDASGATPALSTPPGRFSQSAFRALAAGPNRTRRPSIRHAWVNRRPRASAYSSCSCCRMRLPREAASSPLRTSTAR